MVRHELLESGFDRLQLLGLVGFAHPLFQIPKSVPCYFCRVHVAKVIYSALELLGYTS